MRYALSVYLLHGFIGTFLGGVCGSVSAFALCIRLMPGPIHARAPGDFGVFGDIVSGGGVAGAGLGLVAGLAYSSRTLRAQRVQNVEQTQSRSDVSQPNVWPPPPTGTA